MNTGTNLDYKNELSKTSRKPFTIPIGNFFECVNDITSDDSFCDDYSGTEYILRSNVCKNNRVKLSKKVSDIKSYLLFSLLIDELKWSDDILERITIDVSYHIYKVYFSNRNTFYNLRSELEFFNVITKKNKENKNCSLYYINPSFYNNFDKNQKMNYKNKYADVIFPLFKNLKDKYEK